MNSNTINKLKLSEAIRIYDLGISMRQIQSACGSNITVKVIRQYGTKRPKEECARPNCTKDAIGAYEDIKYCKHCLAKQKKKALKRARQRNQKKGGKQTKKNWKERVFASWADTPEQAAFRRSPAYQQWRIKVLERDSYTCQHCEKSGGQLVVHHIKTFKMNPELRLEPDNGIVLCNNCHEQLHLSRVKKPKILRLA